MDRRVYRHLNTAPKSPAECREGGPAALILRCLEKNPVNRPGSAAAVADCLYAPGLRTKTEIVAAVQAVAPKPLNALVAGPFTTVAELAEIGVRRISTGGALARAAWGGLLQAAKEIAANGTFTGLGRAIPFAEISSVFKT